jgi:EmrB/QacA subfamily drug resistance transporter
MNSSAAVVATSTRKWWILLAVGLGTFMTALDASVANITLPILRIYFNSTVASVEWVVTIYLLLVSGVLLSFGRLGDLKGHKIVYVAGFGIFVVASGLCGIANSVSALVAARAIQAIGGSMLYANSSAIITAAFPQNERGKALGLMAMMTYLGLTVGPSLGGWLTDLFSWRAVFYINLPVGLTAMLLSIQNIPLDHNKGNSEKFDIPGALVFLVGLTSLMLALNRGEEWGWSSPLILLLLVGSLVFLYVFVRMELLRSSPMLDLSLFHNRLFSTATVSALLNYICLYHIIFLMPFFLIGGRGYSASQAGIYLTIQPLMMAISAPISGALSDKIGSRLLSTLGMLGMALGLFMLSQLTAVTPIPLLLLSLGIFGLGTGIFISPNNNALMSSAPKNRQGIASGVLATARSCGMVVGVGLAAAVFTTVQGHTPGGPNAAEGIFQGVAASLGVAAGVALLGSLISSLRGTSGIQS